MSDVVRWIGETVRPWAEVGVVLGLVVAICVAMGGTCETSPERQDCLMAAARGGDWKRMERELDAGVDLEIRDADGLTPLMIAAREGNGEVVERLIARGAKVNAASERFGTALTLACENERGNVVMILLAHGGK
jgi:ankyrin repeat protein